MDAARFDDLLRAFAGDASRRRLIAGMARGLVMVGPLSLAVADAGAEKKRKKKKKKKKKRSAPPPAPPACLPNCDGKACGDDGCGASCGSCQGGSCANGVCLCQSPRELCQGACLAPCAADEIRNPLTCGCCRVRLAGPCTTGTPCCSGICTPSSGGPPATYCDGRLLGAACDFDAQCHSGACRGGACACPEGTEACDGVCVPPCTGPNFRIPGQCACCRRNARNCSEFVPCCSGLCDEAQTPGRCLGRPPDEACEFDEQCFIGSCTLGFCD